MANVPLATLTGNSADDAYAIAAGTGVKVAVGAATKTSANSGSSYSVVAATVGETRLILTLTASCTISLSGGTSGQVCAVQLHLVQDATGSRTVTWPGYLDWGVNGPPALSTAAGKIDRVYLTTDDGGSSWQGSLVGTGY